MNHESIMGEGHVDVERVKTKFLRIGVRPSMLDVFGFSPDKDPW